MYKLLCLQVQYVIRTYHVDINGVIKQIYKTIIYYTSYSIEFHHYIPMACLVTFLFFSIGNLLKTASKIGLVFC